jgi:hypothetical protein
MIARSTNLQTIENREWCHARHHGCGADRT